MIVKDVLKIVSAELDFTDLLNTIELGGSNVVTEEQYAQFKYLINCVNDVNHLISFMYLPLKTTENIIVSGNVFNFSQLSKILIELISVKNENGIKQNFQTFPTFFKCKNGKYTITYTYSPDYVSSLDDALDVSSKIDAYVFASGVVARYYLQKGLYADASAWDTKFTQGMLVAQRRKDGVKMPSRGWF